MPLTTACVGANVTPTVISTWFAHYIDRKPRHFKPTAHISYDEGLNVVSAFLKHAAYHTVEELQAFTAQKIPSPTWVKIQEETVPNEYLSKATDNLNAQLGERGIKLVGGRTWWQWRGYYGDLKCEWIEMKSDYRARKQSNSRSRRVMLYVHGGAYYFGSLETHRYQMQRHARKLKARVFAPSYRLSPQFPFPCGLQDCLAAYHYLLTMHDPTEIVLAGDSAGGGMVLSLLVVLRDQGIPLPAGAILISPWADLTHSFPSVAAGSKFDYIPEHGFMHRPSRSWPPPNSDDLAFIYKSANDMKNPAKNGSQIAPERSEHDHQVAIQGFDLKEEATQEAKHTYPGLQNGVKRVTTADLGTSHADTLVVPLEDNTVVEIKDQIQMYAPNQMLSHPLVSPVLQPSLGGLPPLLILSGGGELLRDEQIYLAHKAADPAAYLPPEVFLDEHDPDRILVNKYGPTNVQLQVWDDLCHVAPTLGWTRPAKFMYRSIAQFGAWALAHAQHEEIDIPEDDASSTSSSSPSTSDDEQRQPTTSIGKAGDPLPHFRKHMIRQRVDRHGMVYHLDPPDSLPALQHPREKIGALNYEIVKKWLGAKKAWDEKFSRQKLAVQRRRIKDFEKGYYGFDNELPPACSVASRRMEKDLAPPKPRKSYGMMMWSLLASKHDKEMIEKEQKVVHVSDDKCTESARSGTSQEEIRSRPDRSGLSPLSEDGRQPQSRSRSRSRIVSDVGQARDNDLNGHLSSSSFNNVKIEPSKQGQGILDANAEFQSQPNTKTPVLLIPGLDTNSGAQTPSKIRDNASTMSLYDAEGVITTTDGATLNSVEVSSFSSALTPKAGAYDGKNSSPLDAG